ncbi:MAG: uncharacterized protein A8A55_2465 [Amphiamblys sp. WSBS2006]|nr:MAG: uncharacterized protein A8A55_2465 [Amphiamblys sp. WSBS2006]
MVTTWNTQGSKAKKWALVESLARLETDVALLQETLEKEDLFLDGYVVHHRPAEAGAGKQGVAVAVKSHLKFRELGAASPFFCIGEVQGWLGRTTVGSVYIPNDRRTATMEELGKTVSRIRETKSGVLLGGDWNMTRKEVLVETQKWKTETEIVEHRGSTATRHGYSRDSRKWSSIDFFVRVGRVRCTEGNTKRNHTISDHWPVALAAVTEREHDTEERTVSRMGIRKTQTQIAHWPGWLDTEVTAENLQGNMKKLADTYCLWNKRKGDKSLCLDKETKELLREARLLRSKSILIEPLSEEEEKRLAVVKREARARCRETTKLRIQRRQNQIADDYANGDARAVWMLAKRAVKRHRASVSIQDQRGRLTVSEEETDSAWATYWAALCEDKDGRSKSRGAWEHSPLSRRFVPKTDLNADISVEELHYAISKLRNWKSAGSDGIPPEWYKAAQPGTPFFSWLLKLMQREWSSGEVNRVWNIAEVVPVPKKGDKQIPDNYRGIALIPVGLKLLNGIIARRLSAALEEGHALAEEQAGFRRGEECVSHLAALTEILGRREHKRKNSVVCFIDFKKAFDRVPHEALLRKAIEGLGFREEEAFPKYLRALYSAPETRNRGGTRTWAHKVGVRQGCPLSPILFSVFINDLLEGKDRLGMEIPGTQRRICKLMFADDVVLLSENTEDLKELIRETELWASRWGMEINPQKCGAFQSMPNGEPTELKIQTGKIPWVEEYRYLGVIFGNKDNRKSRNKAERIRGESKDFNQFLDKSDAIHLLSASTRHRKE